MKRIVCFFLIFALLLPLCACNRNTIENPLPFYYLRREYAYGTQSEVIAYELVDRSEFSSISKVLHFYLRGPNDSSLKTPFPPGTYLLDAKINEDTLVVTLSDSFAKLTGISLTLACCALAKTAIEFSGVSSVKIRTTSALLDGESSVTVRLSDLILYDHCPAPVAGAE